MSMVWLAILTWVVGSPDGSTVLENHHRGCLAVQSTIKRPQVGPVRSLKTARRVAGRSSAPPWSSPFVEECDTPEVDESWAVHLDAMTSIPNAWLAWVRPRSSADPFSGSPSQRSAILSIPLRC